MIEWLKNLSKKDRKREKLIALRNLASLYGHTLNQHWLDLAKEVSSI
jgi:hypothetical protein